MTALNEYLPLKASRMSTTSDRVRAFFDQLWLEFEKAGPETRARVEQTLGFREGTLLDFRQQNTLDLELLFQILEQLDVVPLQFIDAALQVETRPTVVVGDLEVLAARAWLGLAGEARQRWEEISGAAAETIWRETRGGIWEQIDSGEMLCRFHVTLSLWVDVDGEDALETSLGLESGILRGYRERNQLDLALLFDILEGLNIEPAFFFRQAIHGGEDLGGALFQFQQPVSGLDVDSLDLGSPSDLQQLLDTFMLSPWVVWQDRRSEIYAALQRYSGYIERFRKSIGELHTIAQGTTGWERACDRHGVDPLDELGKIVGGARDDTEEAWTVYCFLNEAIAIIELDDHLHPLLECYLQLEMFVADKKRLMHTGPMMSDWLLEPMFGPRT